MSIAWINWRFHALVAVWMDSNGTKLKINWLRYSAMDRMKLLFTPSNDKQTIFRVVSTNKDEFIMSTNYCIILIFFPIFNKVHLFYLKQIKCFRFVVLFPLPHTQKKTITKKQKKKGNRWMQRSHHTLVHQSITLAIPKIDTDVSL